MANLENSIRIATEFAKKWERLASASPERVVTISDSVPDNTTVHAYWDKVAGVWTIGWGNTFYQNGRQVRKGDTITKKQADELTLAIMRNKSIELSKVIKAENFTDNEYAALLSIVYNAGIGNFTQSRIMRAIRENQTKQSISNTIKDSIITSQGKRVQGLVNRREDESRLFSGKYNELYSIYLRNKVTFNYFAVGLILIGLSVGGYYYFKNVK